MTTLVNGNEIVLTGTVGDMWWDDCFTVGEVIQALAQVGDEADIIIRINSGGGIATEGSAIHAAIERRTGQTTIVVEGIAASAASLICMAGDVVEMSLGALMMIHDPATFTMGTLRDHEIAMRCLTSMANAYAGVYAAKSGLPVADCRADMAAEIWLTGPDAVARGYADKAAAAGNDNAAAEPEAISAFDYRAYAHAPPRLVAMARDRGWSARPQTPQGQTSQGQNPPIAAAAAPPNPKMQPQRKPVATRKRTVQMSDYEVGDRVLVPVVQEDGATVYVEGEVTTVTQETAVGVTVDNQDAEEDEWFVDSELVDAPESGEPPDGVTVVEAKSLKRFSASSSARPINAASVRGGERKRISAIMDCDEAKGREALARHFAMSTDMDPAAAKAALKAAPKASAQPQANRFEAAMDSGGNPQIGPDDGAPEAGSAEAIAASVVAAFRGPSKRSA